MLTDEEIGRRFDLAWSERPLSYEEQDLSKMLFFHAARWAESRLKDEIERARTEECAYWEDKYDPLKAEYDALLADAKQLANCIESPNMPGFDAVKRIRTRAKGEAK